MYDSCEANKQLLEKKSLSCQLNDLDGIIVLYSLSNCC